jgi:hypothetical protein
LGRRHRSPGALSVALGVALACQLPRAAHADVPSSEAAAEARRAEAKQRFDEGVNAFREHRWADAVRAFRQADAISPSAPLSFNIAKAYERLDDTAGALRWYRDFMRRNPQAPNAAEVQARITTLAEALAQRGLQQLTVLSTPSGASVTIDEQQIGTAPITLELSPGQHHARLELPGYAAQQADFVLDARTPRDLSLRLEALGPAPATAPSAPPASPSNAPTNPPTSPAGSAPGARPFGPAPWIVLGAGAASLVGALGFELARRSAESAAKSDSQLDYPEHFDAMESRQTTSRVLLGVGGALLVTGGVLLVLNQPKQPPAALALGCGPNGCGLGFRRSFQ